MKPSHPIRTSTSARLRARLHLNTFRGVRAISKFDSFQRLPVRPSGRCYPPFSLDKGRSLGFASANADYIRPVQARFHSGSAPLWRLASPAPATRRLIMQKARRHRIVAAPTACRRMVSGSFTPLPEVLFTFPSRYSSTVGLPVVFSLAGWSPPIRAGFLVSCATQVAALPPVSVSGLLRFRSPLLAESLLFSSPAGTEMFQFPALAPLVSGVLADGFPHSDTRGSPRICRSPRFFAACHVLHRLREP